MKLAIIYPSLFVTGMGYAMAWDEKIRYVLNIPAEEIWIPLSIVWGVLLGYDAWRRIKRPG
jgi:hypothetical protein